MRLADWPRNPFLNDELRAWIRLHLDALGASDVAVYATAAGREEDERRLLVVTEVGLIDSWYGPQGSAARYSLSVRLYPWQAVHGVDLRGETSRLWAHEHESRWRLRISRPKLDVLSDTPELGQALTQFAAACAVMAEPLGEEAGTRPAAGDDGGGIGPVRVANGPAAAGDGRPSIRIEPEIEEPPLDLERRLRIPPKS